MVFFVEVKSFGTHFNELFHDSFFWHVSEYDVLRVRWQDGKPVRDSGRVVFLLFFEFLLEIFKRLSVRELGMADNFANKAITWDDISLNNLIQTFKVIVIANDQCVANSCAFLLFPLHDIDVDEMAILPEFPR